MDSHLHLSELLDRSSNVHRIAPEPIELGDDQYVIAFKPIHKLAKAVPLYGGR